MLGLLLAVLPAETVFAGTVWLDDLNLTVATQDWGTPHKNQSVGGHPLTIAGQGFARGFGTHASNATSSLWVNLAGGAKSFSASVGVDDEVNGDARAGVEFIVVGDGKTLWQSGVMRAKDAAKTCLVDLTGVKMLVLQVCAAGAGNIGDHADWADAKFEMTAGEPVAIGEPPLEPVAPYILTPAAPATPRINGASVFGVRPGSPFLFTIPATGERPMKFIAKNLPGGLKLDSRTGRITGALNTKGEFSVTLRAKNALGAAEKKLRIVCGDQIALTPPMGWNSWNCWAHEINQERTLQSAHAMVASGLANHGWTYINIDDTWQGRRGGPLNSLLPNEKFPDMKSMCDQIHEMGLKAGIYSTPWVTSYARFNGGSSDDPSGAWSTNMAFESYWYVGKYVFAENDAQQFADWGMDYLKYDWNPIDAVHAGEMSRTKRYIVFSLSNTADSEQGADWASLANCWRTTGDMHDSWKSMSAIGFSQNAWVPFCGPGHWPDPDMLVVGQVGWGTPHPSGLNPDEQYTHISLWCLLSAPLLLGCDMEKLDDFTLNLLCNDEVLALNQDPLGKQATCVLRIGNNGDVHVYEKELEDGGRAIGFFNLGRLPEKLDFKDFAGLGLAGSQHVRDLWRQTDLADVAAAGGILPLTIPAHGVMLYKLTAAR